MNILKIYKQVKTEILYGISDDDPYDILKLMCSKQAAQGNKVNKNVFIDFSTAQFEDRGFDWDKSILGYHFWYKLIIEEEFHLAYIANKKAIKILKKEKRKRVFSKIKNLFLN